MKQTNGVVPFLIAALAVSCAAAFSGALASMSWNLEDADPLSYVGIVVLMLAIQLCFFSTRLAARPDAAGLGSALLLYAGAAALLLFAPAALSLSFVSLRLDLLAFALFFAASFLLLFGWEGARPMRFTLAYSLLAWPALLSPLLALEAPLISFTVAVTQAFISAFGLAIETIGPATFASPSSADMVTIAPQCVALSSLIGFAAFMLPVAYYARGTRMWKAAWLAAGVFCVLALNLVRILSVMVIWQSSGLGGAFAFFHTVSGALMFNAAVVLALFALPAFGLGLPPLRGASLFTGKAMSVVRRSLESARTALPSLAVPLLLLVFATVSFSFLSAAAAAQFSWLASFDGATYQPLQFAPDDLALPSDWAYLASQAGDIAEPVNASFTQIIIETASGEQVQITVLSSASPQLLEFDARAKLAVENYSIASARRLSLAGGISGAMISYSRNGTQFTSVAWTQPFRARGIATYAAFALTEAQNGASAEDELSAAANSIIRSSDGSAR